MFFAAPTRLKHALLENMSLVDGLTPLLQVAGEWRCGPPRRICGFRPPRAQAFWNAGNPLIVLSRCQLSYLNSSPPSCPPPLLPPSITTHTLFPNPPHASLSLAVPSLSRPHPSPLTLPSPSPFFSSPSSVLPQSQAPAYCSRQDHASFCRLG